MIDDEYYIFESPESKKFQSVKPRVDFEKEGTGFWVWIKNDDFPEEKIMFGFFKDYEDFYKKLISTDLKNLTPYLRSMLVNLYHNTEEIKSAFVKEML